MTLIRRLIERVRAGALHRPLLLLHCWAVLLCRGDARKRPVVLPCIQERRDAPLGCAPLAPTSAWRRWSSATSQRRVVDVERRLVDGRACPRPRHGGAARKAMASSTPPTSSG